jgi:hypothetical protein
VDGIPDEFCDAEPRVSGARFGFDLMVGVCDEYLGIPELEGALHYNELPEETMCPFGGTPTLGCDDRTWCLPALE